MLFTNDHEILHHFTIICQPFQTQDASYTFMSKTRECKTLCILNHKLPELAGAWTLSLAPGFPLQKLKKVIHFNHMLDVVGRG